MESVLETIHSSEKSIENGIAPPIKSEPFDDDESQIPSSDVMLQQSEPEEVGLPSKSLPLSDSNYTNDEAVTIVYPSPLLSANEGELVNLVHLPNEVDSEIHLEGSELHYDGNVVFQQDFESAGHIAVITADATDGHLELLDSQNSNAIAYFESNAEDSTSRPEEDTHTLLGDHLIHIPTSDSDGNALSLSLSHSLIPNLKLGSIPFAVNGDLTDSLSIPVNFHAINNSTQQNYIIASLSVKDDEAIKSDNSRKKKVKPKVETYPIKKRARQGQVGRPPRIQPRKKLLGTGPMAISAQGVVQEINNRLVTVLPRPEDLKKLVENRQLVIPGNISNSMKGSCLKNKERLYQDNMNETTLNSTIDAEDVILEMSYPDGDGSSTIIEKRRPPAKAIYPRIKRRRGRKRGRPRGSYVVSSIGRRPGRLQKAQTLINGTKGPRVIHTGPESSCVNAKGVTVEDSVKNSSLEPITEDKNEETAADESMKLWATADDGRVEKDVSNNLEQGRDQNRRKLPPRNRGTRYQKMIQALKQTEDESDDEFEDFNDFSPDFSLNPKPTTTHFKPKGTSAPGKRGRPRKVSLQLADLSYCAEGEGTRIIQLGENLNPISTETTPSILIKEGKSSYEGPSAASLQQEENSKLVITFEQPDTGETVVQHISVDPNKAKDYVHGSDEFLENPNICIVKEEGYSDDEAATIFVKENGEYEEAYGCSKCDKVFSFKRDYIKHLGQVHNIRPYECDQCRKTFSSKLTLQHHILTHDLEKPYRCNHCGVGFLSSVLLKKHIETHTFKHLQCTECNRTFANPGQLKRHIWVKENFPEESKCKECGEMFNCIGLFEQHACNIKKHFQCDICFLQFATSSGLNRHRKVHKRSELSHDLSYEYKCTSCHANFSTEDSLVNHVRKSHFMHFQPDKQPEAATNEPLNSEVQQMIQQLQQKLEEEYAPKNSELYDLPDKSETLEKKKEAKDPFLCGICHTTFLDVDLLCDHYSSCHTGDQKQYCDSCMVGCSTEAQLKEHLKIHIEEEEKSPNELTASDMSFMCTYCGKCFNKNVHLIKHLKMHAKKKEFKCQFCSGSFTIRSALDKHMMVHTGQRPYRCDICCKTFRQSAALVRHKLWTHKLKNQSKCEICSKTFFTRELLIYHLDAHGKEGNVIRENLLAKQDIVEENSEISDEQNSDSKRRSCEYCGKEFASLIDLLTHKISHKLSASYKCDICPRTFREKRYLKKHRLTHKGSKTWYCNICPKSFATKLTLIRHAHVHLREALLPDGLINEESSSLPSVLNCDRCKMKFSHKSHYVRHKLLHSGVPLLKCGLCSKMFVHKSDIIRHKVMHSYMFTCDICGRNFHKRPLYLMHRKRHFDDKPFKCDKCDKSFSTSGNFNIHMRIHSGEKPYCCSICDYRCSQSGRLVKHKQMHLGLKPYSCHICERQFVNLESVKIHQRVHTGERPYKCTSCSKTFINNYSLNHHLKEHLKEEIFKCDLCPHKFRRKEHFDKHRQFHSLSLKIDSSVGELYMCEVCGRVFDKKKYLYTHQNVHTRMRLFSCSFCQKELASQLALKNHMLIHNGQMPHKCSQCNKEFRSLSNVRRHEKVHCTPEVFSCEECGENFFTKVHLDDHKQEHVNVMMVEPVNNVTQPLYVFDSVDGMNEAMDSTQQLLVENSQQQFFVDGPQSLLVFQGDATDSYAPELGEPESLVAEPEEQEIDTSNVNLPAQHEINQVEEEMEQNPPTDMIMNSKLLEPSTIIVEERTLDKPHQCNVCFKTFAKKQYLTKHKYRHREVKPHLCDICGKSFAQKFEVAVHKLKHTGEKPYKCEICLKEFRSKVNLTNHKMRHTGEFPYLCSVCHKGFSTQLQLEKHVLMHTSSFQYICQHCSKSFSQQVSLEKHLVRIHSYSLEYSCQHCSKSFLQKPSLEKHLIKVHNYKISENSDYLCQYCQKSFPERMELETHLSKVHSLNINSAPPVVDKSLYHMDGIEPSLANFQEEKEPPSEANHAIKQSISMEPSVETMDMDPIEEERDEDLGIFPVQQEYLKSCLLGAPSDAEEAKFLASILHSRPDGPSSVSISAGNDDDSDS